MNLTRAQHLQAAVDKLATTYKTDKPKVLAVLQAFAHQVGDLDATLVDLYEKRSLLTAEGVQLDIIGRLLNEVRLGLGDEDYRLKLQLKVIRIYSEGTASNLMQIFEIMTNPAAMEFSEIFPATAYLLAVYPGLTPYNDEVIHNALNRARAGGVRIDLGHTNGEVGERAFATLDYIGTLPPGGGLISFETAPFADYQFQNNLTDEESGFDLLVEGPNYPAFTANPAFICGAGAYAFGPMQEGNRLYMPPDAVAAMATAFESTLTMNLILNTLPAAFSGFTILAARFVLPGGPSNSVIIIQDDGSIAAQILGGGLLASAPAAISIGVCHEIIIQTSPTRLSILVDAVEVLGVDIEVPWVGLTDLTIGSGPTGSGALDGYLSNLTIDASLTVGVGGRLVTLY